MMVRFTLVVWGALLIGVCAVLFPARMAEPQPHWLEVSKYGPVGGREYCRFDMDTQQITDCEFLAGSAGMRVWSPDGSRNVFGGTLPGDAHWGLHLGYRNSARIDPLTTDLVLWVESYPAWSPDGEWIAFSAQHNNNFDLYRIRSDGSDLQQLTFDMLDDLTPTYSPDGKWIAFTSRRGGAGANIYVMRANGEDVRQLTDGSNPAERPMWSPDGEWILFQVYRELENSNWSTVDLYRVRPDGTDLTNLTESPTDQYSGSWSPDGKWITYISTSPENEFVIYRMRPDGTGRESLIDSAVGYIDPVWLPLLDMKWRSAVVILGGVTMMGLGSLGNIRKR